MRKFYALFLSILQLEVPTIAVVQGSAIGAGLCLALACDLRLGSEDAQLGMNFVRLGLHPGMGASCLVPMAVGETQAASLLLEGRIVNGTTAAALGLLTQATPSEALEALARERSHAIACGAPLAVADTLSTLRAKKMVGLEAALDREASCQATNFSSKDVRRAIKAFQSKTVPRFEGN